MHGVRRDAVSAACALMVLLACLPALAAAPHGLTDHCTHEDAEAAEPGAADNRSPRDPASEETAAIEAEAVHPLPAVAVAAPSLPTAAHRTLWPTRFVDHFDLVMRLRSIRRLKLLRLWDNSRVTVFFGVNRAGVAGLHIQQQDPNDLPALLSLSEGTVDIPPLRAVPLDSR